MATSVLSVIIDLRCQPLHENFTNSIKDVAIQCLMDAATASCADTVEQRLGTAVALHAITHNGVEVVIAPSQCTAARLAQLHNAMAHFRASVAAAPSHAANTIDPTVLMTLAVRSTVDAVARTFATHVNSVDVVPIPHHVVLLSAVGPTENAAALSNLMSPTAPGVGNVTCCFLQPGQAVPSDVLLHARVRVVRPHPDRKNLLRVLSPAMTHALALQKTTTIHIAIPGIPQAPPVAGSPPIAAATTLITAALSSCSLIQESSPDWLRSSLLYAHDNTTASGIATIRCVAVVPCCKIDEAWLCGVPAVARSAPAGVVPGQTGRRTGRDVASDTDRMTAMSDYLTQHDSVLVLQSTNPLTGGGRVQGAAVVLLLALPGVRTRGTLLLRQLIPAELLRVEVNRQDPTSQESLSDEGKAAVQALAALQAPSLDPKLLLSNVGDILRRATPPQETAPWTAPSASVVPAAKPKPGSRVATLHTLLSR